jgi:hypothetical protein
MKKKIICVLLSAVFAAVGFGCSGGDVKVSFDEKMPWDVQETCTYDVKKIYVGGKEETVVATGKYVTELTTTGEESSIVNTFELKYTDSDKAESVDETGRIVKNKGLTDTYVGKAKFYRNTLVPVSAEKTFNLAQRPLCDGEAPKKNESSDENVNYTLTLPANPKYADPRGYSYTVDYKENKAVLSTDSGETSANGDGTYTRAYKKVNKNISVESTTRFDNEQLNYVVRALSNVKKKGSATFYLSNIFDSYIRGEYVRYTMSMSCAEKNVSVTPNLSPEKFLLTDSEGALDPTDGKYSVQCVQASVGISSSTPGPAISMLITDPSITVRQRNNNAETKKLILEMTYTEYSPISVNVSYKTIYTLTDYTTEKLN